MLAIPPAATWLARVLQQPVQALACEPLGNGYGLVSSLWVLTFRTAAASAPRRLILKTESRDPAMRALAMELRSFEKEIGFYGACASRLAGAIPGLVACGDGADAQGRWLLLEDLRALRAGNQVRGLSTGETEAALRAMARIHARFWAEESLAKASWLPADHFWYQGSSALLTSLIPSFLEDYELRVDPAVIALLPAVAQKTAAIDLALARGPRTLVHGDLRADNLLLRDRDGASPEVVIVDWGSPTRSLAVVDVACLIGGSTPMPQRRGRLPQLLASWHDELTRQGVSGYSFLQAWEDFRLASLRCLSGVLRLHDWQLDEAITPRTILLNDESIERFCALVMELEAGSVLSALPPVPPPADAPGAGSRPPATPG